MFHTSILYWASMFDEIGISKVVEILNYLDAHSEGPVAIHYCRTPCHAAASVGNQDKLKILMKDVNLSYKSEKFVLKT